MSVARGRIRNDRANDEQGRQMHLSLVEVKNFRSFEELQVDLQSGLNVIVGRNNAGKTNLLRAIRHAVGPSASRPEPLWLEQDDFYRASATDTAERTISITLTFTELTETDRVYFYEIVDFDLANIAKSKAIIRFEASWPKGKRQATIRRTGGATVAEAPEVPTKLLDSLPITFLPALRDAEASLAPGYRSRLAALLMTTAARKGDATEEEIKKIFERANRKIERHPLIKNTRASIQETTKELAGSDYSPSAIKAAEVEFAKILRSLRVQMDGAPIGALDANGPGYNNLLYVAVVLEHLKSPHADECPLFLVEEPEAHLHPQLTMLLADYLAHNTPGAATPQTIVTTHSPTLAANVPPSRISVLFLDQGSRKSRCNSLSKAGMSETEQNDLQRMMDITRATLYFAKGIILVEGISEAVLLPVLAKRLGHDLSKLHISIIPICGVAFMTFKKLLDPAALGIPAAIVTDADPPVIRGNSWRDDALEKADTNFKLSDRTTNLLTAFSNHPTAAVFHSKVTLEYDLAEAGDENCSLMADVWEECFVGTPTTFNRAKVVDAGTDRESKAMAAWRGICRADHTAKKAEFAQRLAALLSKKDNTDKCEPQFTVPAYLQEAISHVVESCNQSGPTVEAAIK
jgi:putative ATP-dependent endonuclease of OLD family